MLILDNNYLYTQITYNTYAHYILYTYINYNYIYIFNTFIGVAYINMKYY